MSYVVNCRCGTEFDLTTAPWCEHRPTYTKLCPNGHCICHLLKNDERWREPTKDDRQHGFEFMLKEEYGGVRLSTQTANEAVEA